jgi:carbon starvation protein
MLGTTVDTAAQAIQQWGFTVSPAELSAIANQIGETSVLARTGGAPSLAIGMAHIFSNVFGGGAMALWYHFAIMFEALFILTTLDAGTRVGRFMLQDLGKHVWEPLGRVSWYPAVVISSALVVAMWGHFLYQGVIDPLGGVNSLWPLFGISNQLLAAVALCVGTTIIIKMRKTRYAFVTLLPLAWLVAVTMSAGWAKVFSADPKLGFLAHANTLRAAIASGSLPTGVKTVAAARQMLFNDYLDAAVALFFMVSVVVILADSLREWMAVLGGRKPAVSTEVPFDPVPMPAGD